MLAIMMNKRNEANHFLSLCQLLLPQAPPREETTNRRGES